MPWPSFEDVPPIAPGTLGTVLGMIRSGEGWELGRGLVAELGRRPGGAWCDTPELADLFGASPGRVRVTLQRLEANRVLWRDAGPDGGRLSWVEVNPDPAAWRGVNWRIAHPETGVRFELGRRLAAVWESVHESELVAVQLRFIARPKGARSADRNARPRGARYEQPMAAASRALGARANADRGAPYRAPQGRAIRLVPSVPPGARATAGGLGKKGYLPLPGDPDLVALGSERGGAGGAEVSVEVRTAWRAAAGLPGDVKGRLLERVGAIVDRFGEAELLELLAGRTMPSNVRGKLHVFDACAWAEAELLGQGVEEAVAEPADDGGARRARTVERAEAAGRTIAELQRRLDAGDEEDQETLLDNIELHRRELQRCENELAELGDQEAKRAAAS